MSFLFKKSRLKILGGFLSTSLLSFLGGFTFIESQSHPKRMILASLSSGESSYLKNHQSLTAAMGNKFKAGARNGRLLLIDSYLIVSREGKRNWSEKEFLAISQQL